jgi:hypothetical protein
VQPLQGLLLLQQGVPAGGVAAAQASVQAAAGSGSGSSSGQQVVCKQTSSHETCVKLALFCQTSLMIGVSAMNCCHSACRDL